MLSAPLRAASPSKATIGPVTASPMAAGPIWASQATWDSGEERIIVADPGSARIYVYDLLGRIERQIARPGRGPLEFTQPNLPFTIGNRYLIAASPYHWIWLNRDLVPESSWDLEWEQSAGGKYQRLAPYEVAASGTQLYSTGAAQTHDGQWSDWGVFAVPLEKPRTVQHLAAIDKDEEERSYYLTPPSNLAACSGHAYLLRMAPAVSIVKAATGSHALASFPPEFQKRPSLPTLSEGRNSVVGRQMASRNAAVAEGLFCLDDRWLLLLAHRPRAAGGVEWHVYPIDPVRDVIGKAIELPTTAGEIVFVPGKKRWAVLEKGTLTRVGVQPLTRIVSFPRPTLAADEPANKPRPSR